MGRGLVFLRRAKGVNVKREPARAGRGAFAVTAIAVVAAAAQRKPTGDGGECEDDDDGALASLFFFVCGLDVKVVAFFLRT